MLNGTKASLQAKDVGHKHFHDRNLLNILTPATHESNRQTFFCFYCMDHDCSVRRRVGIFCCPQFFRKDPDGQQLGPCHGGTVTDKKGNIYVKTDTGAGICGIHAERKISSTPFRPSHIHGLEMRTEKGESSFTRHVLPSMKVIKLTLEGETEWSINAPMESGLYKRCKRI